MKLFKELMVSVAIVAVLFLLMGVVLPSKRHIEETVDTNRNTTVIYDMLNGFGRFKDWNAVFMRDPAAQYKISGPSEGKGAKIEYTSKVREVGKGSWTITGSEPGKRVDFALVNDDMGSNKKSSLILTPNENGRKVEIKQTYDVEYGFNLIGRYAGMYAKSYMGEDMKIGLRKLTSLLSDIPNMPYDRMTIPLSPPKVVELPAEDVLVISSGTLNNDISDVWLSVKKNNEWIARTLAANGLQAAGPYRLVTTDYNTANYGYDLVQPVTKAGVQPGQLPTLNVAAPVKFAKIPARRATTTSIKDADFNSLQLTRESLRAWTMVRGMEIADRPYDVYKSGTDLSFTANSAQFDTYWPIKK